MKKKTDAEKFDVIIIGGGAAGMSAALWCDELKLNALLLESKEELGGQLHIVHNPIENHLGTTAENGKELNHIFFGQIKNRKFETRLRAEVTNLNLTNKTIRLADASEFSARAIVIATGVSRRKLGVDGEDRLRGKGILESGKRDAEKVKGKTVCIVGGGDAALENVQILSETAAKIYLVHRRADFRARAEFIEAAKANEKVEILMNTMITEICGTDKIEAVKIENTATGEISILPVDAVLLRIGVAPNTEIFRKKLNLDEQGYIQINSNCETSATNIFAVGDVANPLSPTVSTAVGNGAASVKAILALFSKQA